MPTYRYLCADCGSFDAIRPLSAFADPCICPYCGADAARQLAGPMLGSRGTPLQVAPTPAGKAAHRAGCGCCTPAMKPGTAAASAALGAPKNARPPAPASFLSRG